MMMKQRMVRGGWLTLGSLLLLLSIPVAALAQAGNVCTALVEDSFTEAGTACANLEPNTACVGSEPVGIRTFDGSGREDLGVGDRLDLASVSQARTGGSTFNRLALGVAVINAQANLPSTSPDSVVMAAFGGAGFANDVSPDPAQNPDGFTPMQSFYVNSVSFLNPCLISAPPTAFVQSPTGTPVDMRVNGTNIRLEGTVAFQIIGNRLEMTVVGGILILNPGTPDEVVVPAGFSVQARLGLLGGLLAKPRLTSGWSAPQPVTPLLLRRLANLEEFPTNLLNDPIILPELVQPSGVGSPRTQILLRDPVSLDIVPPACDISTIPGVLCEQYAS